MGHIEPTTYTSLVLTYIGIHGIAYYSKCRIGSKDTIEQRILSNYLW